jgi:hypothetical protein
MCFVKYSILLVLSFVGTGTLGIAKTNYKSPRDECTVGQHTVNIIEVVQVIDEQGAEVEVKEVREVRRDNSDGLGTKVIEKDQVKRTKNDAGYALWPKLSRI